MISYFSSELLHLSSSSSFLPKSLWNFLQSIGICKPNKRVVGLENKLNPVTTGFWINLMLISVLQ